MKMRMWCGTLKLILSSQLARFFCDKDTDNQISNQTRTYGVYDEEVIAGIDTKGSIVTRGNNRGHSKQLFITHLKKELRANFFTKGAAPVCLDAFKKTGYVQGKTSP